MGCLEIHSLQVILPRRLNPRDKRGPPAEAGHGPPSLSDVWESFATGIPPGARAGAVASRHDWQATHAGSTALKRILKVSSKAASARGRAGPARAIDQLDEAGPGRFACYPCGFRDGDRHPSGQRDVDVALVAVNDHPHQVRGGCRR